MSTEIFQKWFENSFVPHVHKELATLGLEAKAVLVLDYSYEDSESQSVDE